MQSDYCENEYLDAAFKKCVYKFGEFEVVSGQHGFPAGDRVRIIRNTMISHQNWKM